MSLTAKKKKRKVKRCKASTHTLLLAVAARASHNVVGIGERALLRLSPPTSS